MGQFNEKNINDVLNFFQKGTIYLINEGKSGKNRLAYCTGSSFKEDDKILICCRNVLWNNRILINEDCNVDICSIIDLFDEKKFSKYFKVNNFVIEYDGIHNIVIYLNDQNHHFPLEAYPLYKLTELQQAYFMVGEDKYEKQQNFKYEN